MATQLTLLCCAATPFARAGGFALPDEPLDQGGWAKARQRRLPVRADTIVRSPARAAEETANAMGLQALADDRLRDMDFGVWRGRSLTDVHASDGEGLARWLADPHEGAPGGETLAAVRSRLRPWLLQICGHEGTSLAITHSFVIRAVLAEALDLPDRAVTRFDIAPLSMTGLSFHRGWRLQSLNAG